MVFAPCTLLSIAPANLFTAEQREESAEASMEIVENMMEILKWFKPRWYCIENPNSSALFRQPIIRDLPTVVVSYCMYDGGKGEFLYRKNTRLATNVEKFPPKRCRGDCGAIVEVTDAAGKRHKHHRETAKQGYSANCKQ